MTSPTPEWPPATPGVSNFLEIAEPKDAKWFFRRYWLWTVFSAAAAAILCAAWLYYFPPQYVSKATVRFLPPQVAGRFVNPNFSMEIGQRTFALSQLLGSRLTASKMIQSFSLYPERRRFQTVEDLTSKFSNDLKVYHLGDDPKAVPTLQISFAYPDADRAQKVVQKLIEQVYEENRKYRGDQSLGTTEFLKAQLNAAEEKVLENEQRLGEIQDSIGVTAMQTRMGQNTSRSYVVDSRLRDLRHDHRLLEERKSSKKAEWEQLEQVQRRMETRPVEFYIPEFEAMQHYWGLRERVSIARSRLERLKERYSSNMPDVVTAENDLREAEQGVEKFQKERGVRLRNRDLDANAARIALAKLELQALDREVSEQQKEEAELRAEAQRLREQQVTPPGQEVELLVAKREYEAAKEQHGQLLKKHEESRAASEMERRGQGESVEMLEPASKPTESERPAWWVRIAGASLFGMAVSMFLCLIHVLKDPKVLHGAHLENWSGLPVLADFTSTGTKKTRSRRAAGVAAAAVLMLFLTGCSALGDTAEAFFKKGEAAEKAGKPALAMLHYRQAVRRDAKFGPAYAAMGRMALRMGELEAARESLARAVELQPNQLILQKQLAETSYQIYFGDPGRPMALLREVEALGERLRTQWPKMPDGYRILSQVLIERHRTEEAIELLAKARKVVERNESLSAQMAAALYRIGEVAKSEEVLEELIESNPRYADAYDLLYLQLMQRREPSAARDVLEQKWKQLGEIEAALQLAAHDDAHGNRTAAARLLESIHEFAASKPLGMAKIGDFWMQRSQWKTARQAYEFGLSQNTAERADYVGRLAEWHLAQNQKAEARQLVETEYKKSPGNLLIEAYLAAVRLGEVPAARVIEERKRLEAILLRMPDSPFVRYHLGRAYLLERSIAPATEQFERAVRLDANYAQGWLALAELELNRGNATTAELRAENVLRMHPGSTRAMLLSAKAQAQRGKLADAERLLATVVAAEPGNQDARFLMALANAKQGKNAQAVAQLETGTKQQPDDVRWPIALSALRSRSGEFELARKTLESAMAKSGQKPELLERLAILQLDLKDGKGATQTFDQLLKQDASNHEFRLGKAGALALSGDREGALKAYAELQKHRKDDVRVWLQPAALLGEMGRTAEARVAYGEALRLNPNHPMVLNNLAWLLLEKGENERQALELAQRAKRGVRQSPEVDGTLAAAYSRLDMHRNATAVYEEMLSYVPATDRARVEKLLAGSRKKQRKEGSS